MSDSPAARTAASMDTPSLLIVIGLTMAWLFGIIGGTAFDSGDDAQALLYSLAAIGGTTAALLLAVRMLRLGFELAAAGFAFFALVSVAEAVAGYTGPGSESVLGSLSVLHLPAMLLIALDAWAPLWARAAAAASGVLFAIVGYDYTFSAPEPLDGDGFLLILAYLTLSAAAIGWTLTVYNESTSGQTRRTT